MVAVTSIFSGFTTDDVVVAKQFYSEILGLDVDETRSGLNIRLPGGGKVFIYPKDDHQPATFTVLNLEVADVDKAVGDLSQRGVKFERYEGMPQDAFGVLRGISHNRGPDIAWFKDPAGNILSVLQEG